MGIFVFFNESASADNTKLSLIRFMKPWDATIPVPSGDAIISQGDKQHLIWDYSNILYETPAGEGVAYYLGGNPMNKFGRGFAWPS